MIKIINGRITCWLRILEDKQNRLKELTHKDNMDRSILETEIKQIKKFIKDLEYIMDKWLGK